MIIIRTKTVDLTTIPGVAYKQKLTAGGSGITLMRTDCDAKAVATINKRDGKAVMRGKVDEKLFPMSAFDEAIQLTIGLPYGRKETIVLTEFVLKEEAETEGAITEEEKVDELDGFVVASEEYQQLIANYTADNGKFSYQLLNKDCIQFADKSKVVTEMVNDAADLDEIVNYIIRSKVSANTNRKEALTSEQVSALIRILDDISTRSAFKELKEHIKRKLAMAKSN